MESEPEKKDLWSFENQGQNYEDYRPKYPEPFITKLIELSKGKKTYLDIATGTGQLLFQLYPYFSEICVGNDASISQLKIAQNNLNKILQSQCLIRPHIELIHSDAMIIEEELRKRSLFTKFDLITIAEALHWFDYEKLFDYINDNLLSKDGILCILSYYPSECEFNVKDVEFRKKAHQYYEKFYFTIRSYFACNQDSIYSGYSDIDFEKYYKNVSREKYIEGIPMSVESFIKYLKTWSGYNTYIEQNYIKDDFVEPCLELKNSLEKDLKEYQNKTGEQLPEFPIVMISPYFLIQCSRK